MASCNGRQQCGFRESVSLVIQTLWKGRVTPPLPVRRVTFHPLPRGSGSIGAPEVLEQTYEIRLFLFLFEYGERRIAVMDDPLVVAMEYCGGRTVIQGNQGSAQDEQGHYHTQQLTTIIASSIRPFQN